MDIYSATSELKDLVVEYNKLRYLRRVLVTNDSSYYLALNDSDRASVGNAEQLRFDDPIVRQAAIKALSIRMSRLKARIRVRCKFIANYN